MLIVSVCAVIKPIYGAASIGVVRVDSAEQLEKTYVRVQQEMAGAKIVDGALVQGDHDREGVRSLPSYLSLGLQELPEGAESEIP